MSHVSYEVNHPKIKQCLELIRALGNCDEPASIIEEVHARDSMFSQGGIEYYYGGIDGIRNILLGLKALNRQAAEIETILDFGSGFGRTARFLKAYFSAAEVVTSDINPDAINFCEQILHCNSFASSKNLAEIIIPQKYDLIYCASVFTHLPAADWRLLISKLAAQLKNNGILLFTTLGQKLKPWVQGEVSTMTSVDTESIFASYEKTGFGFFPYKTDGEYGVALSTQDYTKSFIATCNDIKLLDYRECGLCNFQDVFICVKQYSNPALTRRDLLT